MLAVLFTLAFARAGLGRDLPLDTTALLPMTTDVVVFIGYLYFTRTLVRLPFAIVITIRRTRYAQQHYGLRGRESLNDGFARGFLDTRRWTVEPLALVDRLGVFIWTLLATTPYLGVFIVKLGGLVGIGLLLVLYLFRGKFGFLVEDMGGLDEKWSSSLPFLKTRGD
jgi:hypothetical protein